MATQTRTSTTLLNALVDPRDEIAWRRFYARYMPMLLSCAKRAGLSDADAQDAVAETLTTFVQAYRAGRYDRGQGRLKSWLGGIAQNKIRKRLSRRIRVSVDAVGPDGRGRSIEPAAPDEMEAVFEREWRLDRLHAALEIIRREADPDMYQAFDLYAIKEWPVTKVAAFLNTTPNAVYINKTRTLKRLRQVVDQLVAEEE